MIRQAIASGTLLELNITSSSSPRMACHFPPMPGGSHAAAHLLAVVAELTRVIAACTRHAKVDILLAVDALTKTLVAGFW
ncbi:MAG TPA: hypothetical protein QF784_00410 [Prochlorococcaceae cyanobacterium Fu_MAG_134]|nr:hypothetical protein [Prochlorococcaceae cyanobacterium Fu_MAG_134]